jgi:murein DD-endopeptidase MepM/ murein hydrolase activator NlpD
LRRAAAARAGAEPVRDLWLAGASGVAIIMMAAFAGIATLATYTAERERLAERHIALPPPPVVDTGPDIREVSVEHGDTLAEILIDEGAPASDARAVVSELARVFNPASIRAGQALTLTFGPPDRATLSTPLLAIAFKPNVERDVAVIREGNGAFKAEQTLKVLTARDSHAAGAIDGSLYLSARAQGVPDGVIVGLIKIFSYDVDFQREVRSGDKFELVYTSYYDADGVQIKGGDIAYAALTLSGERKELYRFTTSDDGATDYFTPKGWSGKRMLMKTPIDGARITSNFGRRRHPVLGYTRMHRGVDFGAPTGTPVMAAGNGIVEFIGWHGGHGKYVRIRHGAPYKTAYAHLSRYARGLRTGMRVRQGQVIAFVGSTGMSTGPHLHYEVLVRNNEVNPLGVKLPTGRNLEGKQLIAFRRHKAQVDGLVASLPLQTGTLAQGAVTVQPVQARILP